MKPPFKPIPRVDFAGGFDPSLLKQGWAIGGYNVQRKGMYTAPQYKNTRNVHMGIDIWAPAGEPVYSPLDGVVAYTAFHDQDGNYGATNCTVLRVFNDVAPHLRLGHGHDAALRNFQHLLRRKGRLNGNSVGRIEDLLGMPLFMSCKDLLKVRPPHSSLRHFRTPFWRNLSDAMLVSLSSLM